MHLVSACLAGLSTRYNGKNCCHRHIRLIVSKGKAVPLCPEQLGGLPTPREAIELIGGDGEDLLNGRAKAIGKESGTDYTKNLIKGAEEVIKIASLLKIETAILKDGSPSCGSSYIRLGRKKVKGKGVTTAALLRKGIKVKSTK